jgi:hypothetical protein
MRSTTSPSAVMVVLGTTIHEFRGAGPHSYQANSWVLVPRPSAKADIRRQRMTTIEYER